MKNQRMSRSVTWALAGLLLLGFLARLHTYNEPLETDLAEYAVVSHELLDGRELYSDIFQQRPPLLYATYGLAEKWVGYGQQEVFFLGWLAFALTLLGVHRAASMLGFGEKAGLWASLFWTLLSSDMLLEANQPNTEVFMNALLIWAFALLMDKPPDARKEWIAGGLLAVGTLYKPYLLLWVMPFLGVRTLFAPHKERASGLWTRCLLPTAGAWGLCFSYMALTHRAGIFFDILFVHNRYYAGNILSNLWKGVAPGSLFPHLLWVLLPLVLLTVVLFLHPPQRRPFLRSSFAAFLTGTYLILACSGKFFPHYYQLWLPLLCVGGAWGGVLAMEWTRNSWRNVRSAPLWLCLGALVAYEGPTYLLDAKGWSMEKYGNWFVQGRELGEEVGRTLKQDEGSFFWGDSASPYFYSRKSPPTGVVVTWTGLFGPLSPILTDRMFRDLQRTPPELVVFDDLKFRDFYKHFLNKYRVWRYASGGKRYLFLVRKGGKLEKRLKARSFSATPRSAATSGI